MNANDHIAASTLARWGKCKVIKALAGGYRNRCYLVECNGEYVVAKTSRRSEHAIAWLECVHDLAEQAGFRVPRLVRSRGGNFLEQSWTMETYLKGRKAHEQELPELAPIFDRFHDLTSNIPQRPGFASSIQLLEVDKGGDVDLEQMPDHLVEKCRRAWRVLVGWPQSVVHADLNPSNVLIPNNGKPALIDWDEARVDATLFDTLPISDKSRTSAVLKRALVAWEVAAGWHLEPEYARKLAVDL